MSKVKVFGVAVTMAGIVLIVCRYVFLPFTTDHRWVQHIGIGMIVAGGLAMRSSADEVPKSMSAIAAMVGAAVALGAFFLFIKPVPAHKLSLVEHKFPGFTIQLPKGTPASDTTLSANGEWRLDKVGRQKGFVQVNWQPGHNEFTVEQYAKILGITAPGVGKASTTAIEVSGHTGRRLSFAIKDYNLFLTAWHCDKHDRDYSVSTAIRESRKPAQAFHVRLTAGAQCHVGDKPDVVAAMPLVSLPASYGHLEGSAPAMFRNLDGEDLAVQVIPQNAVIPFNTKPALALAMFSGLPSITGARLDGQPVKTKASDGSDRSIMRIRYMEAGAEGFASLLAMDCSPSQSFVGLHTYSSLDTRTAAEAVLLTARCAKGAVAQNHATATQVFGKACDARDGRGCYHLAALAGAAVPPRTIEAEHLYNRGCEFDHGLSCNDFGVMQANSGKPGSAAQAMTLYNKACKLGTKLGCTNATKTTNASKPGAQPKSPPATPQ